MKFLADADTDISSIECSYFWLSTTKPDDL